MDVYAGAQTGRAEVAVGIELAKFQAAVVSQLKQAQWQTAAKRLCELLAQDGIVWINVPFDRDAVLAKPFTVDSLREAKFQLATLQNLWSELTGSGAGDPVAHWIPQTLARFVSAQNMKFPRVSLIPAIRQIEQAGSFESYNGAGLIGRLAEIQSPDHDRRQDRTTFDQINAFLRAVTGKPQATIDIPHNRQHVLVHMDDKVLPISSLGMGIHEVVMIAAFCTLTREQIVCIEEPEIHLHPILQRKLVQYLRENTSNQYFVATHSPSFIDTPGAAIFHVANDGNQTTITESLLRAQRFSICNDLGTKASDILQSNSVVWVEGPSDRIYLLHWLRAVEPELIEGIHFSIMFYGGRLLSHLSADSEDVKEFISLRSLNQHLALVMDSDRESARHALNATKERLLSEFNSQPGVAWVTKGREIENYLDFNVLQAAVKQAYPDLYSKPATNGGSFDHALLFVRKSPGRKSGRIVQTEIDKVKVARIVCQEPADLGVLDLRNRISQVAAMIADANKA